MFLAQIVTVAMTSFKKSSWPWPWPWPILKNFRDRDRDRDYVARDRDRDRDHFADVYIPPIWKKRGIIRLKLIKELSKIDYNHTPLIDYNQK